MTGSKETSKRFSRSDDRSGDESDKQSANPLKKRIKPLPLETIVKGHMDIKNNAEHNNPSHSNKDGKLEDHIDSAINPTDVEHAHLQEQASRKLSNQKFTELVDKPADNLLDEEVLGIIHSLDPQLLSELASNSQHIASIQAYRRAIDNNGILDGSAAINSYRDFYWYTHNTPGDTPLEHPVWQQRSEFNQLVGKNLWMQESMKEKKDTLSQQLISIQNYEKRVKIAFTIALEKIENKKTNKTIDDDKYTRKKNDLTQVLAEIKDLIDFAKFGYEDAVIIQYKKISENAKKKNKYRKSIISKFPEINEIAAKLSPVKSLDQSKAGDHRVSLTRIPQINEHINQYQEEKVQPEIIVKDVQETITHYKRPSNKDKYEEVIEYMEKFKEQLKEGKKIDINDLYKDREELSDYKIKSAISYLLYKVEMRTGTRPFKENVLTKQGIYLNSSSEKKKSDHLSGDSLALSRPNIKISDPSTIDDIKMREKVLFLRSLKNRLTGPAMNQLHVKTHANLDSQTLAGYRHFVPQMSKIRSYISSDFQTFYENDALEAYDAIEDSYRKGLDTPNKQHDTYTSSNQKDNDTNISYNRVLQRQCQQYKFPRKANLG